jgi:hypothetical protein
MEVLSGPWPATPGPREKAECHRNFANNVSCAVECRANLGLYHQPYNDHEGHGIVKTRWHRPSEAGGHNVLEILFYIV